MAIERKFKGKWICADMVLEDRLAPVFRRAFSVEGEVKVARAFVCGLGLFELRVNGELADDTVLNPAHTQYSSTVLYREFNSNSIANLNFLFIDVAHTLHPLCYQTK